VHCTRIAGTGNYVTTNREGGQPLCFTHLQIQPLLVHTKDMFIKHERGTGQMRKAAIKFNRRTAVVWSTKVHSVRSSKVMVYDGGNSLLQTTDEEIATTQKWLSAPEYDNQPRQEIDALWKKWRRRTCGSC
jgi:hypothetical protein